MTFINVQPNPSALGCRLCRAAGAAFANAWVGIPLAMCVLPSGVSYLLTYSLGYL